MKLSELQDYTVVSAGTQTSTPQQNDSDLLSSTAGALDVVFGGGKIGEAIGTQIARSRAEDPSLVSAGPSAAQVAGDVVRTGLTFLPVGKAATGATTALRAAGLTKGATTAGNIIAGGATGAAFDVAEDVRQDQEISLGGGTLFGAGIPAATPVGRAIGRVSSRVLGRTGSEVSGALTGTSAETLEQAFTAARKGGVEEELFTSALRGKTTPEQLVQVTRENVAKINSQRQGLFRQTIDELGDSFVETKPAKLAIQDSLKEAGIKVGDNGLLDFSGSKLKLVPQAQTKIQTAFTEVNNLPGQTTLRDIDTTRQAVKALSLTGDDPSANLGNKLLDDTVRGIRTAGEDVPGYGQMLDEFGETSQFLDELQRGLSTGDKKTIDQTYRRMATALKTNNEQRMSLVRELDDVTDGAILSQISGQQLSEVMPRGIFRQIAAGLTGTTVITGTASPALLPGLLLASPRVVGEFVRALGIGSRKADILIESISQARGLLIKAGIIGGSVDNPSDNE